MGPSARLPSRSAMDSNCGGKCGKMARVRQTGFEPVSVVVRWMPAYNGGAIYQTDDNSYYRDYCQDDVGVTTDHPLQVTHRDWTLTNPTNWEGTSLRVVSQPVSVGVVPAAANGITLRNAVVASISTARIINGTGPLTPKVNSLVFLSELRWIPRMLQHAGNLLHNLVTRPSGLNIAREAASATLAYQFGWRPLVQDIIKMLDLADLVAERQRELTRLYSGEEIRKKLFLGNHPQSVSGTNEPLYTIGGMNLRPDWKEDLVHRLWATVHWQLRDLTKVGTVPSWQDAFRATLGLNLTSVPMQIWKALPWSWAVDWFAGISDLLGAAGNMVMFRPTRINLMCLTTGKFVWKPYTTGANRIFGGSVYNFVYKYREQRSLGSLATTNLRVPFLDSFKLSILASFTILGLVR